MVCLLTARDVCETCQISRGTLQVWMRRGLFPQPLRVGRTLRWDEAALREWIDSGGMVANRRCDAARLDRDIAQAEGAAVIVTAGGWMADTPAVSVEEIDATLADPDADHTPNPEQ